MSFSHFFSTLKCLQCPECGRMHNRELLHTFCAQCNSPLLARYDLATARHLMDKDEIDQRPRGLWRWHELLPICDRTEIISLGEGDTPLLTAPRLAAANGLKQVYIKDESGEPTGSFKARGLAVAVSKAIELGVKEFVIPTAGNAGGALSAYAARAGKRAHIFMPKDAPVSNIVEVEITGGDLHLVDGLISDAGRLAHQAAEKYGWFDVSTLKEPYRLEGKKTMGLELAEAFHWDLPDVIVYPTGGGTGLIGMWKAFQELEELGWIGSMRPKMVSVQSAGCAPIVKAFDAGNMNVDVWPNAETIAAGLRVPKPFADRLILRVIYESQGFAVAVSDQEIVDAQKQLGTLEGIFAAPEGAATLAGISKLVKGDCIDPESKVLLYNTGTGMKYINQQPEINSSFFQTIQ